MSVGSEAFAAVLAPLQSNALGLLLAAVRLVPVAFMCPVLGGSLVPTHLKLGIVLALAGIVQGTLPTEFPIALGLREVVAMTGSEVGLGVLMGLGASAPFAAARMAGLWASQLQGVAATSAFLERFHVEPTLGEALHGLLVACVVTGVGWPLIVRHLLLSYRWAPLGSWVPSMRSALLAAGYVRDAFATGVQVAAPVLVASLAVDAIASTFGRLASAVHSLAAPLRATLVLLALVVALGSARTRLEAFVEAIATSFARLNANGVTQ